MIYLNLFFSACLLFALSLVVCAELAHKVGKECARRVQLMMFENFVAARAQAPAFVIARRTLEERTHVGCVGERREHHTSAAETDEERDMHIYMEQVI